mmetsp:Transcript_1650/g.2437  ORF Transcript_1650/g.2437 Transcript_1650/m.2437 type:complete len:84 (-) Transcript_1650:62-313(-)
MKFSLKVKFPGYECDSRRLSKPVQNFYAIQYHENKKRCRPFGNIPQRLKKSANSLTTCERAAQNCEEDATLSLLTKEDEVVVP